MEAIDRNAVLRLLAEEPTQLVDVLGPAEYDEEHLPGAINIPLPKLGGHARERLDPSRPVVVYCYDYQ